MKFSLLLILFCSGGLVKGQPRQLAYVDDRFFSLPASVTQSTASLASYITSQFSRDDEKIRAAYRWVTANIRYDKDSMLYINWSKTNDDKIAATLRRRKGVCDNFASIFTDLLLKMRIPAFSVNGLTLVNGSIAREAHSWCAVQFENNWYLCDPTWDANYNTTCNYYMMAPASFIQDHIPFDPLWQLLSVPVSNKDFERGNIYAKETNDIKQVHDSVAVFLQLDSVQQLVATARRMQPNIDGKENLKTWYNYNNMNIAIYYGEQDMNLYNAAVASLNKANELLNTFIRFRNNLFQPALADDKIVEMLRPIDTLLKEGYEKTAGIGLMKENFQYDTVQLKERLKATDKKLGQQKTFLQEYLRTASIERQKLFYK